MDHGARRQGAARARCALEGCRRQRRGGGRMSATKRRRGRSWSSWSDMRSGPKPPPPAHGVRIKTVGTTWWGQRWIEALEKMSRDYASRLARGKTYARTGRVHDLVVDRGKVTARVTGSSRTPYEIALAMPVLDDASWSAAIG